MTASSPVHIFSLLNVPNDFSKDSKPNAEKSMAGMSKQHGCLKENSR